MSSCCPVCGGALEIEPPKLALLTPQQRRIVEIISERPGRLVTTDKIIAKLYSDDVDGGPMLPKSVIFKQLHLIRKHYPNLIERYGNSGYRLKS